MRNKILIFALAAAAANVAGAGEIYRCVAANGGVSYTNIACPAKSKVERVASYEPDHYVPPPAPAYDASTRAAEDSADEAREAALEAREAAAQAGIAYEQAQEQQAAAAPPWQEAVYSPLWAPVYLPSAPRSHGGRDHRRQHAVLHFNGARTPVRSPRWATGLGKSHAPRLPRRR